MNTNNAGFIAGYSTGYIIFTAMVTVLTAIHGTLKPFTAFAITATLTITGSILQTAL